MKNDISIGKTLASSFQYLFSNFSKRLKDGFPAVIFITIAFNILNYLMSNKIATNFTVMFFFLFVMIITSAIGICVHEEILNKKKVSFLREFLSKRSLKYFFNFLALTLIALSPLLIHFVMRKVLTIQNENVSAILIFWIFTTILSLKLIFILPKLALGINFKYNAKELNMIGSKLFLLFTIVTIVFLVPSMIYLTLQLSFMTSYKDIYQAAKPLFDVGSFYISYFNYLTVFAVISYAFKEYISK